MFRSFIILILYTSYCFCDNVVNTNVGSIKGYLSNDGYYQYLGIPYGVVSEDNPFGIALPHPPFPSSSVYDANTDAVHCPQFPTTNGTVTGVIDCLTLNVYVPTTATPTSNLPVMIIIYGGFFHNGYTSTLRHGPKFLVRHDVIFVSFNYRTGPYGFMCLNTPQVPGNQGLRDQYLAFKWVKDNIAAFGGNPDQITVVGLSAGGHAIDLHLLAEKERLFNKVIIQSGSAFATTVLYPPDREAPVKIAKRLGFDGTNTADALEFLKDKDPRDVMTAASVLDIQYKPCVERIYEGVEPYISKEWINSSVTHVNGVPILIGGSEYERAEYHLNKEPEHFENIQNIFRQYLNQTFDFDDETMARMELYLRRFYVGDSKISEETAWNIVYFESDYLYNYPTQRTIRRFLDNNSGNIYYYQFSFKSSRNGNIAAHSNELVFLFDNNESPLPLTEEDQLMIDKMTALWTNFVKYSNPTPQTTELLPVSWIPLTKDTYNYLRIDENLSLERRPFHRRMAFLELFYRLNGHRQKLFEPEPYVVDENVNSASVKSVAFTTIVLSLAMLFVLKY